MDTITVTIPSDWVKDVTLDQEVLRQALELGLNQLRQQQTYQAGDAQVVQAMLSTGRIRHLAATWVDDADVAADRQSPPTLPGPPVSEILIAQRRGEV